MGASFISFTEYGNRGGMHFGAVPIKYKTHDKYGRMSKPLRIVCPTFAPFATTVQQYNGRTVVIVVSL